LQVADGDGEGVRCVMRRRCLGQAEQQPDHLLYLMLVRAPVADHGTLHFGRGVLDDLAARLDSRENRDAARVAEAQRAAGIHRRKQVLHRHAFGTHGGQQGGKLAMDPREARGEGVGRLHPDRATAHEPMASSVGLDAPIAGALRARIDAEDPHAREASISFSSMSKFAQTCCTSS
jgi:hypothetical protein